ncbi:SCO2524 family protein [Streptomyces sp. SS7]|uniref:SCO2524 family protein n=1 Tax=Streptomyces sp. SS7 TaxID=3108485 RepID=UPI0030ECA86D
MQIKPRQHLLEMWRALARHSFEEGEWSWGDGGRNSVADAERLLCLLYPATEIDAFRLDDPDTTQPDVARALARAGDTTDIPLRLVEALADFMAEHRDEEGPTFSGGHYYAPADPEDELTEEQRAVDAVDSYSMSVSLCLATLEFCKGYRAKTRREPALRLMDGLTKDANARLTAAMVGLLRSFTVNVVDISSKQGEALAQLLGRGRLSDRQVVQRFQDHFASLRALIAESFTLGLSSEVTEELRNENRLFECGWAWSVVNGAPEIDTGADPSRARGRQPRGVAHGAPYLHFTVVALDGIIDLFSDRTFVLGLLDAEQQKLADALRLRWEITQQYWSTIARFEEGAWPLEAIPWRTTPGLPESAYFSLTVVSILVHDLMRRRATEHDLTRLVSVMERLAERGGITGGVSRDDPAVAVHSPGVAMPLLGSGTLGPPMTWTMSDFSTQLFKRTVQLCALSRDISLEDRLLRLAEDILDHIWRRRISEGEGAGLWDDVHAVHPEAPVGKVSLSWSITERVSECMVAAHTLYGRDPIRSPELSALARSVISEAAHLLGKEQEDRPAPAPRSTEGEEIKRAEADLRRARGLVDKQPGTAYGLALGVLRRLDVLTRARETD